MEFFWTPRRLAWRSKAAGRTPRTPPTRERLRLRQEGHTHESDPDLAPHPRGHRQAWHRVQFVSFGQSRSSQRCTIADTQARLRESRSSRASITVASGIGVMLAIDSAIPLTAGPPRPIRPSGPRKPCSPPGQFQEVRIGQRRHESIGLFDQAEDRMRRIDGRHRIEQHRPDRLRLQRFPQRGVAQDELDQLALVADQQRLAAHAFIQIAVPVRCRSMIPCSPSGRRSTRWSRDHATASRGWQRPPPADWRAALRS